MWHQTELHVLLAALLPNASDAAALDVEASPHALRLGAAGGPPVIERRLSAALSSDAPFEVMHTGDRRIVALRLPKGQPGSDWTTLFASDTLGYR